MKLFVILLFYVGIGSNLVNSISEFKPGPEKMAYEDAVQYCRNITAPLILPAGKQGNVQLGIKARQFAIIKRDPEWNQVWLNTVRSKKSDDFLDAFIVGSETKLGYTNFIPGRDKQGDCVILSVTRKTTFTQNWMTVDCNAKYHFFCHD